MAHDGDVRQVTSNVLGILREIIHDAELGHLECRILLDIALSEGPDRAARLKHRTVGDRVGCHPDTVSRLTRGLEAKGKLEVTRSRMASGFSRANRYRTKGRRIPRGRSVDLPRTVVNRSHRKTHRQDPSRGTGSPPTETPEDLIQKIPDEHRRSITRRLWRSGHVVSLAAYVASVLADCSDAVELEERESQRHQLTETIAGMDRRLRSGQLDPAAYPERRRRLEERKAELEAQLHALAA